VGYDVTGEEKYIDGEETQYESNAVFVGILK